MKLFDRIKIGLGIGLLASLTGCVGGYVGVDEGYGGTVVVPVADPFFGGGIYEGGRDYRGYGRRGAASRAAAHFGGRGGGRGGGGKR